MNAPSRAPQARSVATRQALLDAAIACVCADGYAAVTTTSVARRAGVSRGAQQHHFPTKAELMVAAVEHALTRRVADFDARFGGTRIDALGSLDAVFDALWSVFQGPTFIAWAELWIAARTDAALASKFIEIDRAFTDDTRQMMIDLAARVGVNDEYTVVMLRDFSFAVLTGVALQRLVPRGQRPAEEYLAMLKQLAVNALGLEQRREGGS